MAPIQHCRIDSRLTALFKITRGLLSVYSHGPLAGHVVRTQKVSSCYKLACPLSDYSFSREQLFSGKIYLLLSLANTAL